MMWRAKALFGSIAIAVLIGGGTPSVAESPQWWRAPTVQQELRLTKGQVAKIEQIFRSDLSERRHLAREQEALEARLAAVLLEGVAEEQVVSQLAEQVAQAQARRNVCRTRMLLRMYRVLTAEQQARVMHTPQSGR
jgi:Spy/CpxP family protein refolding chaperone